MWSSSSSSSSISSCDNVARFNNEAAFHIRNGDYSQATECLSSALFALKAAISNKVCSSNVNDADTSTTTTTTQQKNNNAGFYFVSSKYPTTTTATTSDLECNDWFLHRDAIEINSDYHSWAGESDSAEVLLSYPIIYNLGLCHHLEAVDELSRTCPPSRNADGSLSSDTTPDGRASSYSFIRARLQRAVTLYLQAQKLLLANDGLLPNNNSDVEEVLHVMAVTNNLGHAHHFLHNDSSSKVCFQRLLQTIVYISESNGVFLDHRHQLCFDGYLSNVMKLIGTSQAAPAA